MPAQPKRDRVTGTNASPGVPAAGDSDHRLCRLLLWGGLVPVALVSLGPLLLTRRPVDFVPGSPGGHLSPAKLLAIFLLLVPVVLGVWADRTALRRPLLAGCAFLVLAGVMTALHVYIVDRRTTMVYTVEAGQPVGRPFPVGWDWQRYLYLALFNGKTEGYQGNGTMVPHVYRPLPYGFTRSLELLTGDWWFACLAYRCFFNFWLLWATYRFVGLFTGPRRAALGVLILLALYPLSIVTYWGQLTDPFSHALFVLSLLFIVEDYWPGLFVAVVLGVLAKESAVVLVPAYWAVHYRQGLVSLGRAAVLGLGATAAFLAARMPLGWRPGSGLIHSMPGLMILTNLGIGTPLATSSIPLYQRYLHLFLFVGIFLPFIALRWRHTDPRLRALFLTLAPLLVLSNLAFSWVHESRNFVPLLPVLIAMALTPAARAQVAAGNALPGAGRAPSAAPV
jgi:hypothetical protein